MSFNSSLWSSHDSGVVVDVRETSDVKREPLSRFRLVQNDGSDEGSIGSQWEGAPSEARATLSPNTHETEISSYADNMSEAGFLSCSAGMNDLVENFNSFMDFARYDSSAPTPEASVDAHPTQAHLTQNLPPKQQVPDFSLRKTEIDALLKQKKHLSLFAFGRLLTIASIVLSITALVLAFVSKKSTHFSSLQIPLEISPQLDLVKHVGLVNLQLCYNETADETAHGRELIMNDNLLSRYLSVESVPTSHAGQGVDHNKQRGCFVLKLTVDTIEDLMWNVSRTFLSLAIAFGTFLTIMLCSTIYWESINLKPVALGLLMTYFFQSLSFFFFDSDLCREFTCQFSEGSLASIFSSLCWFMSALCCIRMDIVYQTKHRQWIRRRNRALKKIKLQRKASEATELSSPISASDVDDSLQQSTHGRSNLTPIFDIESQDGQPNRSSTLQTYNRSTSFELAAVAGQLYEA